MTPGEAKRLKALERVTDAAYAAARLELKSKADARQAIADQLAQLDADRARAIQGQATDPAMRAGADLLWQRWADEQRRSLNRQLAQARAAENRARANAARTFGRHQALIKTVEKMR